jgi:hypothetical protein
MQMIVHAMACNASIRRPTLPHQSLLKVSHDFYVLTTYWTIVPFLQHVGRTVLDVSVLVASGSDSFCKLKIEYTACCFVALRFDLLDLIGQLVLLIVRVPMPNVLLGVTDHESISGALLAVIDGLKALEDIYVKVVATNASQQFITEEVPGALVDAHEWHQWKKVWYARFVIRVFPFVVNS